MCWDNPIDVFPEPVPTEVYLCRITNREAIQRNLKTCISTKQSTPNFPKNEHILPPDTHTYVCVSRGKKCSIFGKFGVLCFLETRFLRFVYLPYYRCYIEKSDTSTSLENFLLQFTWNLEDLAFEELLPI